jgi:hypothetical protein
MAHSVLLVPVRELEAVVRPRLERLSPRLVMADPDAVHAHITLLGPFADLAELTDGMRGELRSLFADVTAFPFRLTEVCRFPGKGPTYLSPDPPSPFRQLTSQLHRHFPEFPPYGGRFDGVVPHLSIPVPDDESPDAVHLEMDGRLPVSAVAREVELVWFEPDATRVVETFGFGTSAA